MTSSSLEHRLKARIMDGGKITFHDFMKYALYEDEKGYYSTNTNHIGADGDYYTSPSTHPAFGSVIALQIHTMWNLLDKPSVLTIVEGGGGKGRLAEDILKYASSIDTAFFDSLDYWILEKKRLGKIQRGQPVNTNLAITWTDQTDIPEIEFGVFLSNELFDANPRHRVIGLGSGVQEKYVGLNGDDFIEIHDDPSTDEIASYFKDIPLDLPEGCIAEVDLEGPKFIEKIAAAINKGFVITIDYGFPAEILYSNRYKSGTLFCYHKHTSTTNPYIRIGKQDITAHVDFTSLSNAGSKFNLVTEGLLTQQRYLKKLGIQSFIDVLRSLDITENQLLANRMALLELTNPEGFGGFGVLVQSKGFAKPQGIDSIVISIARGGLGTLLPPTTLTDSHIDLFKVRYPQYNMMELWPVKEDD
jgi:SAM-dependent MidA family methyltransferase